MIKFNIYIFFILIVAGVLACKKQPEKLPSLNNFDQYIEVVSHRMCYKMHQCFGKIFRTLPKNKRDKITSKHCIQTVLNNKQQKINKHTPEMKVFARSCYSAILSASCNKFGEVAFFSPDCVKLNLLTDEAFRGIKPPVAKLE